LNFSGDGPRPLAPAEMEWLTAFSDMASAEEKSLISRYRLMDVLLQKLNATKTAIEESLTAKSPLQRYDDVEKDLRDKWEDELTASIEAEYRRQRTDLLAIVQRWLRDVWLLSLETRNSKPETPNTSELLNFPQLAGPPRIAKRITANDAMENLQIIESIQRLLHTNVQEALALEVGLLKLHL
jgi:hypothetical protein